MEMQDMLERLREQLDGVDNEILYLLKRRFQITKKIAKYKHENKMEIFQPERETLLLNNLCSKATTMKLNENFIQDLYEIILSESKKEQEKELKRLNN